jgi:hypothetical protein
MLGRRLGDRPNTEDDLADAADTPIFIIGSARSGTTLLRMMLDSHPRISCGEETKFLADMRAMVTTHWRLLETYGFERDWWIAHIHDYYASFQQAYMTRRGKLRWADKTPVYTLHLDFIDELFPAARYVHLVRDGRDVVASFRDRWGYLAGVRAANSVWAQYVRAALAWESGGGAGRTRQVRYEALVNEPQATMRELLAFLGEPWDDRVVRFDEVEHDTTERYARFTRSRRDAGGERAAIYRSRVGVGRARLDPFLRGLLERSAGGLLDDLGYR